MVRRAKGTVHAAVRLRRSLYNRCMDGGCNDSVRNKYLHGVASFSSVTHFSIIITKMNKKPSHSPYLIIVICNTSISGQSHNTFVVELEFPCKAWFVSLDREKYSLHHFLSNNQQTLQQKSTHHRGEGPRFGHNKGKLTITIRATWDHDAGKNVNIYSSKLSR